MCEFYPGNEAQATKNPIKMSHHNTSSDKVEPITKDEWQKRLENFEFKQADMNKLIMNYLVTGECWCLFGCDELLG